MYYSVFMQSNVMNFKRVLLLDCCYYVLFAVESDQAPSTQDVYNKGTSPFIINFIIFCNIYTTLCSDVLVDCILLLASPTYKISTHIIFAGPEECCCFLWCFAGRLRDYSRVESYSSKHNWSQHHTTL